jgi:uncharacterized protein (TIGR02996 family)
MAPRKPLELPPTRSEVLAFLDDIKGHPDDDTPRLILADWLEERDDLRGEFIRVKVEQARVSPTSPRGQELKRRDRELFRENEQNWYQPYKTVFSGSGTFHRGLLQLIPRPERLRTAPWDQLRNTELLAWVDSVHAWFEQQDQIRHLASSPLFERLVRLVVDEGSLSPLCHHPAPHLIALWLRYSPSPGQEVEQFVKSSLARQLRELSLTGDTLNRAGLQALAGAPGWDNLRHLNLWHNKIGSTGARLLARSSLLKDLESLEIGSNNLRTNGTRTIFGVAAPHLHTLGLGGNNLGDTGVEDLTALPARPALRTLHLDQNGLTSRAAVALAGAPLVETLTEFNLFGNHLGDEGARALADSPRVAGLTTLAVSFNDIGDEGARALAASPYLERLILLNVEGNQIGTAGKKALQKRFGKRVHLD